MFSEDAHLIGEFLNRNNFQFFLKIVINEFRVLFWPLSLQKRNAGAFDIPPRDRKNPAQ